VVYQRFSRFRWPLKLFLLCGLAGCQQGISQPLRPEPLPQEELIQVYMNQNQAGEYTDPYRQQTRAGDNLEQITIDAIASAKTSVDVAVQELRLPGIAAALVDRQQAGIRVRVILEDTYSRPYSQYTPAEVAKLPEREQSRYAEARRLIDLNGDDQLSPEEIAQRDALIMLDKAGIPRIDDRADGSAGSNLMHHKFVVVDGRTLIVTSANFTLSDVHGDLKSPNSRGNANNLLKINSPELSALFIEEFNQMWGDGPGGKRDSRFGVRKTVRPARQVTIGSIPTEVQFSPTSKRIPWERSSNGLIGKTATTATQSVVMALFVFSDQQLVNLLETVHQRQVDIRALIDPGFAYRPYSEALDMLGIVLGDEDCKVEADNRPWSTPITTVGVPRMPPGDLLHHKFGVVDQQIVITGSHNWTAAANEGNDETVLIIKSPIVAAHFQREFERLYTDAVLGIPPAIQKKADAYKQRCQRVSPRPGRNAQTIQPAKNANELQLKSTPKGSKTKQLASQRINLNTATQAELDSLPGVGPSLAKRIIAARKQKPFTSLADLDKVSGVGPKLLANLEDKVTW